jgi:hypothetical protein
VQRYDSQPVWILAQTSLEVRKYRFADQERSSVNFGLVDRAQIMLSISMGRSSDVEESPIECLEQLDKTEDIAKE